MASAGSREQKEGTVVAGGGRQRLEGRWGWASSRSRGWQEGSAGARGGRQWPEGSRGKLGPSSGSREQQEGTAVARGGRRQSAGSWDWLRASYRSRWQQAISSGKQGKVGGLFWVQKEGGGCSGGWRRQAMAGGQQG
jgi:hypothetical protein